ncbi:hypothetical protein BDB01DRAFT_834245 [Pilobolus umbonatus]|nr:hypothetical protein BDB01DRAFT_834245 [Pilobolus umbonatus]
MFLSSLAHLIKRKLKKKGSKLLRKSKGDSQTVVPSEGILPISVITGYISMKDEVDKEVEKANKVNQIIIENAKTSKLLSIIDPLEVFPHTNAPNVIAKKTIIEETKLWTINFTPQFTFGSFQHIIRIKIYSEYYYKGGWPLVEEDLIGMMKLQKEPRRNVPTKTVQDNPSIIVTFLFPAVPKPAMPKLDHLELLSHSDHDNDMDHLPNGKIEQEEILPCPSMTSFLKYRKEGEEKIEWKNRLEMLQSIQEMGCNEEHNGTQVNDTNKVAVRIQLQFLEKAEQIMKETHTEPLTDKAVNRSSFNLNDGWDKLYLLNQEKDLENNLGNTGENTTAKQGQPINNKPPFFLLLEGFFLSPLWLTWAVCGRNSKAQQAITKAFNKRWKMYSKKAFYLLSSILIITGMIILIMKPSLLGFRFSNTKAHNEERVVFDDSPMTL